MKFDTTKNKRLLNVALNITQNNIENVVEARTIAMECVDL